MESEIAIPSKSDVWCGSDVGPRGVSSLASATPMLCSSSPRLTRRSCSKRSRRRGIASRTSRTPSAQAAKHRTYSSGSDSASIRASGTASSASPTFPSFPRARAAYHRTSDRGSRRRSRRRSTAVARSLRRVRASMAHSRTRGSSSPSRSISSRVAEAAGDFMAARTRPRRASASWSGMLPKGSGEGVCNCKREVKPNLLRAAVWGRRRSFGSG